MLLSPPKFPHLEGLVERDMTASWNDDPTEVSGLSLVDMVALGPNIGTMERLVYGRSLRK